jgi:hypothetical protein
MGARYSLAVGICAGCYTCMSTCLWPSGYLTVMGETHTNTDGGTNISLFLILITILSVPFNPTEDAPTQSPNYIGTEP